MFRALCCLAVLAVAAAAICEPCTCGVTRGARVMGGAPVAPGEFPWLAALHKGKKYICGSTIVARDHLITAAHCVKGIDVRNLNLLVGVHNISDPTAKFYKVEAVAEHPKFNSQNYDNDLAVLKLAEPLPDHLFRPLCLPENGDGEQYLGQEVMVAGWGAIKEKGDPIEIAKKVPVKVWDLEKCATAGYGHRKVTPRMICANAPASDACNGDSGGPLLHSTPYNTIIGVTSWGRGCARPNYPGVYTRVKSFMPWLKRTLRNACLCSPPTPF